MIVSVLCLMKYFNNNHYNNLEIQIIPIFINIYRPANTLNLFQYFSFLVAQSSKFNHTSINQSLFVI
jgi:hypothetical protein